MFNTKPPSREPHIQMNMPQSINLMATMTKNVSTNLKFGESRIGQKPKTEFCDRKTVRNSSNLTKPRRMGPQMKKMLRATLNFSPSRFFDENVRNQRHKLLDRSPQEQSVQATSVANTIRNISVVVTHFVRVIEYDTFLSYCLHKGSV